MANSSEILGGYNPIEWKSDYGKDSFMLPFKNKDNILSRLKREAFAIIDYSPDHGPGFGASEFIYSKRDICFCNRAHYEKS